MLRKLFRGKLHDSLLLESEMTELWLVVGKNALNRQA